MDRDFVYIRQSKNGVDIQVERSKCVCGKDGDKVCGQCKKIYYCSIECQKSHWLEHKLTCIPAKKITQQDQDQAFRDGQLQGISLDLVSKDSPFSRKDQKILLEKRILGSQTNKQVNDMVKKHVWLNWRVQLDEFAKALESQKGNNTSYMHFKIADKTNYSLAIFYVSKYKDLHLVFSDQPEGVYEMKCNRNNGNYHLTAETWLHSYSKLQAKNYVMTNMAPVGKNQQVKYLTVRWSDGNPIGLY